MPSYGLKRRIALLLRREIPLPRNRSIIYARNGRISSMWHTYICEQCKTEHKCNRTKCDGSKCGICKSCKIFHISKEYAKAGHSALFEKQDSSIVLTPYGGMVAVVTSIQIRMKQLTLVRFPYNPQRDAGYQDAISECLKVIKNELRKARKNREKINRR